jgi:predicted nucleic acid-binding protein
MTEPLVFVDSNVLIYSEDPADPAKQARAFEWLRVLWQRRIGRLSTQVLNEFYVNVTRKIVPPMPTGDARAKVRRYVDWNPWQIDAATVESAWAVEARYGLHFWDSLVIASAQHLGCNYVLSEDMAHEQHYGNVQVLNPFLAGMERLQLE